jgi:hypothetical protein
MSGFKKLVVSAALLLAPAQAQAQPRAVDRVACDGPGSSTHYLQVDFQGRDWRLAGGSNPSWGENICRNQSAASTCVFGRGRVSHSNGGSGRGSVRTVRTFDLNQMSYEIQTIITDLDGRLMQPRPTRFACRRVSSLSSSSR